MERMDIDESDNLYFDPPTLEPQVGNNAPIFEPPVGLAAPVLVPAIALQEPVVASTSSSPGDEAHARTVQIFSQLLDSRSEVYIYV